MDDNDDEMLGPDFEKPKRRGRVGGPTPRVGGLGTPLGNRIHTAAGIPDPKFLGIPAGPASEKARDPS